MLDDERNHPIFLHCLHGKDRTGLMVAIFRMARQGWSFDKAYTEMKLCGFHSIQREKFQVGVVELRPQIQLFTDLD